MKVKNLKSHFFTLFLFFVAGCISKSPTSPESNPLAAKSFNELKDKLLDIKPNLKAFGRQGPFEFQSKENYRVQLSRDDAVLTDLFLPDHRDKAPMVIFVHGNRSLKDAHRYQAEHLASWGFITMVVQVPNTGQWLKNGERIYSLVSLVHSWPQLISKNLDTENIFLTGHSFGGSAVTIAAGMGAPTNGLILLDPAVVHTRVKSYMQKVKVPVMLLGADSDVFRSRRREAFANNISSEFGEISIAGATHDDAQLPTMTELYAFGFDPFTSAAHQQQFLRAITSSAFSLYLLGSLDYAFTFFNSGVQKGIIKEAKRKLSVRD